MTKCECPTIYSVKRKKEKKAIFQSNTIMKKENKFGGGGGFGENTVIKTTSKEVNERVENAG